MNCADLWARRDDWCKSHLPCHTNFGHQIRVTVLPVMSLVLLNDLLSIASYDGGHDDEEYAVGNVLLLPPTEEIHCSQKDKNCNLLLEAANPLTVTHLVVHKRMCSAVKPLTLSSKLHSILRNWSSSCLCWQAQWWPITTMGWLWPPWHNRGRCSSSLLQNEPWRNSTQWASSLCTEEVDNWQILPCQVYWPWRGRR